MLKRNFDILFSIFMLVLLSPVLILTALLVKLASKGPVLFKHKRAGKDGKDIFVYKFRTMVLDAEKIGPGLTERNDSRITKIGALLRKTSLDELPQFFNVLEGSMSIVGPRPEIPEIVKGYSAFQRQVLSIRPGITGLPQVNGRADLTIPKKLRLDVYYTKKMNFCFDLYLIFKTIIVLVTGKGAF
ncbi:MAG: sugar transferase [Candidatus Firestonebacteria bacterium]